MLQRYFLYSSLHRRRDKLAIRILVSLLLLFFFFIIFIYVYIYTVCFVCFGTEVINRAMPAKVQRERTAGCSGATLGKCIHFLRILRSRSMIAREQCDGTIR